tara:strand:- start:183 stop:431 length:249 start_codon:yes stop_codon:yes gene_type:complete
MNKKQATKWALSKDNPNHEKNKLQGGWTEKKITPPNGWPAGRPWTEKEAAEADAAASFGFDRSDFTDTGEDLQELKEIVEGN